MYENSNASKCRFDFYLVIKRGIILTREERKLKFENVLIHSYKTGILTLLILSPR